MTRARTGAATVAAGLLVLAACGGGDDGDTQATTTVTEPGSTAVPTTASATTAASAPTTDPTTTLPAESVDTTAPGAVTAPSTVPSDSTATTTAAVTGVLWQDPTGTFQVAFPTEPTERNVQAELPDGTTLPVKAYLSEVGGAAAIASCVQYPDGTVLDDDVLDNARDGALANVGAELVDSEPITLQGRDGVSYRGAIGEAGAVLARTYLDGLQICQVLVVGEPDVVDEVAPPFLDSYEFLQEAAA